MLEVGTNVAGYQVKGVLGHGGMGVVYEATQLSLNRTIALKVLAEHLGQDPAFRERFRREGRIQAAIDHPNIVTIYEAGERQGRALPRDAADQGPSLKDMIMAMSSRAARTLRLLRPVADALDTAHEAGLIHRDIKPQNILVGARDHPICRLRLTKEAKQSGLTRTGQFVGTIDYIAPEQISGKPATPATDVYALHPCCTNALRASFRTRGTPTRRCSTRT